MVRAGLMGTKLPCTASHEGTGVVVAMGSEVTEFNMGDRVMAGLPKDRCGHCKDCLGEEGYRHYCPNTAGYVGVTLDGAFAEYVLVDGRESCVIPDSVSFETAAPLACAGCTVFRGLLQTELKKGETVALVGAGGGLGHLGVQFAKAMGMVVVGIDARDEGMALARESGADVVVDARAEKGQVVRRVQEVTNGMGVDATVNVSDAEGAAALACAVTRMHGTVVQIAQVVILCINRLLGEVLKVLQPAEVSIPFHELIFRDVRMKGSLICTRQEAQLMLQTVADHNVSVKTNPFFGLNEIPKLVELAESGKMAGKGVIIVDEEEMKRVKEGKTASLT